MKRKRKMSMCSGRGVNDAWGVVMLSILWLVWFFIMVRYGNHDLEWRVRSLSRE